MAAPAKKIPVSLDSFSQDQDKPMSKDLDNFMSAIKELMEEERKDGLADEPKAKQ
jgi:hypothetical protein